MRFAQFGTQVTPPVSLPTVANGPWSSLGAHVRVPEAGPEAGAGAGA